MIILPEDAKKNKKKQKKLPPNKTSRAAMQSYLAALTRLNATMKKALEPVNELLRFGAPPEQVAQELTKTSKENIDYVSTQSEIVAPKHVEEINKQSKKRQ